MDDPFKPSTYYISANRLNLGLNCPFKLALYLMQIKPAHADYSNVATGSAVHAYMEDLPKHKFHREEYYIKGMYEKDKDKRQVVPPELYDKMRLCMKNGREWFGDVDYVPEVKFEVPLTTPKGRKVVLNGRIDAQTDTMLWDWKTAKHVDTDEYRRAAAVYDYATGFKKDICYKSLFNGEEIHFPHADKTYVPNLCDQYIDRLEDLAFNRHRQFLCKYCDYELEFCFRDAEYKAIDRLVNWNTKVFDDDKV